MTRQSLTMLGLSVVAALAIGIAGLRFEMDRGAPEIVIEDAALSQRIAVEVVGAVSTPGVYRLDGDARVQDAIDAAGGARADADLTGLNLARRLDDEERLEIPSTRVVATPTTSAAPAAVKNGTININTASAEELDALPGIGPALAGRIVAYRQQHGPFASVEELSNVSGISPKMVETLRPLISVTQ